jgi:RNA polymerase sigma-70 factor (ECF subfamily)
MTQTAAAIGVPVLSDRQLMAQMKNADVEAFSELYDRYCDRAYRVARHVCHDGGRAEDAVQNAFLAIWRSRATYLEQRGSVAAWLLTAVRNSAIDITRRDANYIAWRDSAAANPLPSTAGDIPERVEARAEAQHIRGLLARLPETQQAVIALAFYAGLSHTEIATHLDLPNGTVKSRIRLGLQKLRTDLER